MPSDASLTRLLYAILSQKCLKDIDWSKVAQDPVLSQEISNGHAARMRYSRFKRQMEGTPPGPSRMQRGSKRDPPTKVGKRSQARAEFRPPHNRPRMVIGTQRPIKDEPDLQQAFTTPSARPTHATQAYISSYNQFMPPAPPPGPSFALSTTSAPRIKNEFITTLHAGVQSRIPTSTPDLSHTPIAINTTAPLSQARQQAQISKSAQTPAFTYPSPGQPLMASHFDEAMSMNGYGMPSYPMAMGSYPVNMNSSRGMGTSRSAGMGSERQGLTNSSRERDGRTLLQQGFVAGRLLGDRPALDPGLPYMGERSCETNTGSRESSGIGFRGLQCREFDMDRPGPATKDADNIQQEKAATEKQTCAQIEVKKEEK